MQGRRRLQPARRSSRSRLIPPLLAVAAASVAVALFAWGRHPAARSAATPAPVGGADRLGRRPVRRSLSPSPSPTVAAERAPVGRGVRAAERGNRRLTRSAAPEGVDQWAWDRKLRLLTQGNPFDVGKPIGGTQDTSDGRARVQWFEQAVMYKFQDWDQSRSSGRRSSQRSRSSRSARTRPARAIRPTHGMAPAAATSTRCSRPQTILCVDTDCIVYPRNVFQEWLNDKDKLGQPTGAGVSPGGAFRSTRSSRATSCGIPSKASSCSACDAEQRLHLRRHRPLLRLSSPARPVP